MRRSSMVCRAAVLVTLAIAGLGPVSALACACCTHDGQRRAVTQPLDSYGAELLASARLSIEARLVLGEQDVDSVKAVTTRSSRWRVGLTRTKAAWRLAFDDTKGGRGTLQLPLPATMHKLEVDPREPDDRPRPHGPVLYVEWRFAAKASGTGMLAGTWMATLIFHGRGNSCPSIDGMTAWTLELVGARGPITLIGAVESAR